MLSGESAGGLELAMDCWNPKEGSRYFPNCASRIWRRGAFSTGADSANLNSSSHIFFPREIRAFIDTPRSPLQPHRKVSYETGCMALAFRRKSFFGPAKAPPESLAVPTAASLGRLHRLESRARAALHSAVPTAGV